VEGGGARQGAASAAAGPAAGRVAEGCGGGDARVQEGRGPLVVRVGVGVEEDFFRGRPAVGGGCGRGGWRRFGRGRWWG